MFPRRARLTESSNREGLASEQATPVTSRIASRPIPSEVGEEAAGKHCQDATVQGLRDAMREEWANFRERLDLVVLQQLHYQEELFARLDDATALNGCASGSGAWPLKGKVSHSRDYTDLGYTDFIPVERHRSNVSAQPATAETPLGLKQVAPPAAVNGKDLAPLSIPLPLQLSANGTAQAEEQELPAPKWRTQRSFRSDGSRPSRRSRSEDGEDHDDTFEEFGSVHRSLTERSEVGAGTGRISYSERVSVSRHWADERSIIQRFLTTIFTKRCIGIMHKWNHLQEPQRTGMLARIVMGRPFEMLCATVIIINALVSAFYMNGQIEGDRANTGFFLTCEYLFMTFYTIELALKLSVHGRYYFCNADMRWNIFDFVLVVFSLVDVAIMLALEVSGGGNFTFMRTIRMLKMARVLRGLRVLRLFTELRLLLNSLIGSFSSLMWSIVMLCLIFYVFSLVFVQGTLQFVTDPKNELESKEICELLATDLTMYDPESSKTCELLRHFGAVELAVLSLYKACTGGDDWSVFFDALIDTIPMYAYLFTFFIAFSQIALMNILTAIFVERAIKLAQPDRDAQALEQRSAEIVAFEELKTIMQHMDTNHSGTLSMSEFTKQIRTGKLGAQLSVLGLNIKDAPLFFDIVAEEFDTDEIPIDDFIEGCMRMRGQASCIDMSILNFELKVIKKSQEELQSACLAYLQSVTADVELTADGGLNGKKLSNGHSGCKELKVSAPSEINR